MRSRAALVVLACALGLPAQAWGSEAERLFRVASRLAAERSPEAAAAYRKVVDADPQGPLADDAWVGLARLDPLADWPEKLGDVAEAGAKRADLALERVVREHPGGDRAGEARYLRALLRLEPLDGHDPEGARAELIEAASVGGVWGSRARYALAWWDELRGDAARAHDAYTRILIDAPQERAAAQAAAALGRLALGEGEAGRAADWLQRAVEAGAEPADGVAARREAAMRLLLHGAAGLDPAAPPVRVPIPVKAVSAIAVAPGGVHLAERREGRVVSLDAGGGIASAWRPGPIDALAADERGTVYAAGAATLWRLHPGGTFSERATLGDFAPVASIAAARGGFVLLDRRGSRIGWIGPGDRSPKVLWESKALRMDAVAWDGERIRLVESRGQALWSMRPADAGPKEDGPLGTGKAGWIAAGPAGRLAVTDRRQRRVLLFPAGTTDRVPVSLEPETTGIERPGVVAIGPDGAVHVVDEAGPRLVSWR